MVQSAFKFTNPKLENIQFAVNEKFIKDKYDGMNIEANTSIAKCEDKNAVVKLQLNLGGIEEQQPFEMTISMSAKFRWEEEIPEDKIDNLLQVNGAAILLSYIRPTIAYITTQAGLPPFHIPFMNMTKNE